MNNLSGVLCQNSAMGILGLLIPVSIGLGLLGLAAFLWALRSGQFEDLEGDQARILFDEKDAPED